MNAVGINCAPPQFVENLIYYLYATGWIGSHRSALVMANLSRLQQDGVIQEPNSSVVVVEQHLPPFKPFQRF